MYHEKHYITEDDSPIFMILYIYMDVNIIIYNFDS